MEHLTITTTKYEKELTAFITKVTKQDICTVSHRTFYWHPTVSHGFYMALVAFIYSLATSKNPIYRHSKRLKTLAMAIQDTSLFGEDVHNLESFLQHNTELSLEGYVNFRLEKYQAKLDALLYHLIKKINITTNLAFFGI